MPVTPHPVTFTVYETDNTTVLAGARVVLRNVTKKTELIGTDLTNSSGVALMDLANLPLGDGQTLEYEAGDEILLIASYGNFHDAVLYTVSGNSKDISLYMNHSSFPQNDVNFLGITVANTAGSAGYCIVYDYISGDKIKHIECPANNTVDVHIGGNGKRCRYVIEREANTLVATATYQ